MAYKVLVQRKGVAQARTAADVRGPISEARNVADRLAEGLSDEAVITIRFSNPKKRYIQGYKEPSHELYKVLDGIAYKIWDRSAYKKRGPNRSTGPGPRKIINLHWTGKPHEYPAIESMYEDKDFIGDLRESVLGEPRFFDLQSESERPMVSRRELLRQMRDEAGFNHLVKDVDFKGF